MQITIAGVVVPLLHGTTQITRAVGQRSQGSFQVYDTAGTMRFYQGQPVLVTDNNANVAFRGVVATDDRVRPTQGSLLVHTVTVVDNHYYADKRLAPYSAANTTAGAIAGDLVTQFLASEGVTTLRGVNLFSVQQSDIEGENFSEFGGTAFLFGGGSGSSMSRDTSQAWHGIASLKVTMDGSFTFQSISVNLPAASFTPGGVYTVSCYLRASVGQTPNLRMFFEGNDQITGNHAIGSTPTYTPVATGWTRYTVTATLPNPITDTYIGLRLDTGGTAQAVTFWMDGLQMELAASATAWEQGGGVPSVQSGPTVVSLVSNYAPCSDVLDALVQKAGGGWYWLIDDNKILWFQNQTSAPAAPYTIDDTLTERGTDTATHDGHQYRNKQYMLGGVAPTASQTNTRIGDGHTTAFVMDYPLNSVPTITLNTVAQTVGILGIDSGKQWYWNAGSNVITQDSGGTHLATTDTLSVTYVGQFPTVVISSDSTAINTQATREGGGTTGLVEAAAYDTTLTSTDQAFQSAAGYLSKYAHDLDTFQALTRTYGFAEGQVATVNVPAHDFTHESMLIESVVITDAGPVGSEIDDLYYALKCVSGPINTGWQAWYKALAGQAAQVVGAITLGQSQTLALLESVNETWTWTESVTPTVYVCFTFPVTFPKTFC